MIRPTEVVTTDPVKVWNNSAFESTTNDIDDCAMVSEVIPPAPATFSRHPSRNGRYSTNGAARDVRRTSSSGARASAPGIADNMPFGTGGRVTPEASAERAIRHSKSGTAWLPPQPASPRVVPSPSTDGVMHPRTSQPASSWAISRQEPHRLSYAGRSPSSRQSAAGSEVYPLGQLFVGGSPAGSPTTTWVAHGAEMASRESSAENHTAQVSGSRMAPRRAQSTTVWASQLQQLLDSSLRSQAILLPAPSHALVRCYVRRSKGGLLGMQYTYRLYLEEGDLELMSAVKSKPLTADSPSYMLYHGTEAMRSKKDGSTCIAKVCPNATGSFYSLKIPSLEDGDTDRRKMAAAAMGANMPELSISFEEQSTRSELRSMHCILPGRSEDEAGRQAAEVVLCTRQPDYSDSTGFTLPFEDRFFQTSVKNFQLVRWDLSSQSRGDQTLLQFGKLDSNLYALDFKAPLCVKTAFAIALAATEAKYMNSSN